MLRTLFLNRYASISLILYLCLLSAPDALAQYKREQDASIPLEHFYIERQGPRKLISKLTFGLSTGFGRTNFRHELDGFQIIQVADSMPVLYRDPATSGYRNWFNRVTTRPLPAGGTVFDGTQEKIGFKSKSFNIPIRATLHVEFNRFRVGGGYSFEYTKVNDFNPITRAGEINPYISEVNSFFLKKYFGSFGASVYRYYEYLLVVDANLGGYKLGRKFDNSLIKKGIFFNLGVTVEREMSEYFRLFIRPSYELKGYNLSLPETGTTIRHSVNAFYFNVGATYRIPELRKCFVKNCKAQMHHAHGNREYRSRVHPIYKKQNPHYGENYPVLIKYKGKNKKKLNPY